MTNNAFIPVNEPLLDGNEAQYVLECVRSGWISSEGPYVERFENELAQRVKRKHGIAVANGSAALDVAVAALRLAPGDEVILPSHTIISCASAIVRAGAVPVVVDSHPSTWNMDVAKIEERITRRTRALMAVHIFGLPVDMKPLVHIASKHGLRVIEDAAQAIGLTYEGEQCGGFGDISTFSFYPNKHITTGEGGMIVCHDDELAMRCRSLRNLCFQPARRFVHEELGWNYRMSNLQAALGVAQLESLTQHLRRKREIGLRYRELLGDIPGLIHPPDDQPYAENLFWVYGVMLDESVPFDALEAMKRLGQLGVATRPFFWPIHEQPVLRKMGWFANESCPVAEGMARRGFYVPSGLAVTSDQQQRVAQALRRVIGN